MPTEPTKRSPTAEALRNVIHEISVAKQALEFVAWTPEECDDEKLGGHVNAVRAYLDNAAGRTSSAVDRVHQLERETARAKAEKGRAGLCPICGEEITLTGETRNGRMIGSCGDAFNRARWEGGNQ